jgi:hypothetical protein
MSINNHRPVIPTPTTATPSARWANAIINPGTRASMEHPCLIKSPKHKTKWTHSLANEFGSLAQGMGGCIAGANTIFFICHDQKCQKIAVKTSHVATSVSTIPTESRKRTQLPDSWRQPHQTPRRSQHPHLECHQTRDQQCHFHL